MNTYILVHIFLTHISPKLIIHRVSGDAPKDLLVAPELEQTQEVDY